MRAGRTIRASIEAGFDRAWSAIRDSNVSTLITCAILYWFGSRTGATLVQGFALILAVGVLVSMFTAITVSRTFFRILLTRYSRMTRFLVEGEGGAVPPGRGVSRAREMDAKKESA